MLSACRVALEPVYPERLQARFLHLDIHQAVGSGIAVQVAEDLLAAFLEAAPILKAPAGACTDRQFVGGWASRPNSIAVNKAVVYDAAVAILPWHLRRLKEIEARLRKLDDIENKLRRLEEIERMAPSMLRRLEELKSGALRLEKGTLI